MAKAKRNGRTITYDVAYEEVVADSMETMLSDGAVMEKLEKLKDEMNALLADQPEFTTGAPFMAYYNDMHAFSATRKP